MQTSELMAGGALAVSILALFFSVQAAWPQIKESAESLRDLVLWLALAAVLAGLAWLGWNRYDQARHSPAEGASQPEAHHPPEAGVVPGERRSL